MPSEKRQRQRDAREARLAAQAKAKKRRTQTRNTIIVAVVAVIIVGIVFLVSGNNSPKKPANASGTTTSTTSSSSSTTTTAATSSANKAAQQAANALAVKAGCPASTSARTNTQTYSAAPAMTINTNDLYSATVVTTDGTFTMSLYAKAAPKTVNSFVFLADKNYFHCAIFHRVIPGFVDQTGDPTGTGTGGPGYEFANENIPTAYATGDVAMANSGANTNGSQFFIVAPGGATQLDNDIASGGYSLFGAIISGQNVINAINAEGTDAGTPGVVQRIISVTVHQAAGS